MRSLWAICGAGACICFIITRHGRHTDFTETHRQPYSFVASLYRQIQG